MPKPTLTIKPKPEVNEAALEAFITGNDNVSPSIEVVAEPAVPLAMQPAGQQASQQASQPAALPEPTAMLSVRVPTSLHHKLRIHSVTVGRNIQDIVTDLLINYLVTPDPE